MAIYGLTFAIAVYSVSLFRDNILQGCGGLLVTLAAYLLGNAERRKRISENRKLAPKLPIIILVILRSIIMILGVFFIRKISVSS